MRPGAPSPLTDTMKKSMDVCDRCKADGFFERHAVQCASCGRKAMLCPSCWPTYVTCSDVCKERWREDVKKLLYEPISPKHTRRRKKIQGQGELFA